MWLDVPSLLSLPNLDDRETRPNRDSGYMQATKGHHWGARRASPYLGMELTYSRRRGVGSDIVVPFGMRRRPIPGDGQRSGGRAMHELSTKGGTYQTQLSNESFCVHKSPSRFSRGMKRFDGTGNSVDGSNAAFNEGASWLGCMVMMLPSEGRGTAKQEHRKSIARASRE